MDALRRLHVVSKITEELEGHCAGLGDADLAGFILHLAEGAQDEGAFKAALKENDGDFGDAFIGKLFRTIRAMVPREAEAPRAKPAGDRDGGGRPERAAAAEPAPSSAARGGRSDAARGEEGRRERSRSRDRHAPSRQDAYGRRDDRGREGYRDRRDDRGPDGYRGGERARGPDDRPYRAGGDGGHYGPGPGGRGPRRDFGDDRRPGGDYDRQRDRGGDPRWDGRGRGRVDERRAPPSRRPLETYGIYDGRVSKLKDFGAFVEIECAERGKEGLAHVSQLSDRMVRHPSDVLSRGDRVKVKVISIAGDRISLSVKEVDQSSGRDLFPQRSAQGLARLRGDARNGNPQAAPGAPGAPGGGGGVSGRRRKRLSSPERWELRQLVNSGQLPASALDEVEEEVGSSGRRGARVETEEDLDVEINDVEPPFLRGQSRFTRELEPVRVFRNPDGSMQRAATTQVELARERREMKAAQSQQLMDSIPKDLSRPWEDPMPEEGERHFAQELRGINLGGTFELPEWKSKAQGNGLSFGKISDKSIREQRLGLPIATLKAELCRAIADNQVLVVIGETGSGKTTQMTQYMAEMGFTRKGIIGCTQPRRVAATSVAKRVAEEYGCELGQEVGYTIRFDDQTTPETVIKYMTDGMLLREYLMNNDLSRYSAVMLDEAHERTIHTDVLFGLLKDLCQRRPEFKLIVTSATLDAEKFSRYFFDCPIFTIPGRTFPVEILYAQEPEPDYVDAALSTVMQIHLTEEAGDVLVFLTGQEEIDTFCEILYNRMKALGDLAPELIVLPVYSSLPSEMQSRIFEPAPPGARKCVVATNIAEASLTLDGVHYVVDAGFAKLNVFNAKLGMDSLVVTPISQASARQRAGRAGRTGPGKCYRLYTELAYRNEMMPSSVPEIQRTSLGNVVLQLKAMGINDLIGFDFMDPPPTQTLVGAMEMLYALGALDGEGLLTRLGRKMAEFPLEPQLSKMLITSVEFGCSEEILTIVAMLSVENPFYRPRDRQAQADMKKARFFQPEGDHLTLLAVYEAWAKNNFSNPWAHDNFLQARSLRRAQDVRKQLVSIMDRYQMDVISAGGGRGAYTKVQRAIVAGYFMNAAKKDPQEGFRTLVEQNVVYIHPSSALFNKAPDWVLYQEVVLTTKEYLRNAMIIDPRWLVELAPNFYRKADDDKMSKAKRSIRLEPLYDRFAPPNAWRLSKRRA